MATVMEHGPITAADNERPALNEIDRLFRDVLVPGGARSLKLVGPQGEEIALPDSVYRLLRQVVHELAQGKAVTVVPVHQELTTQEAADILNVSRPYLVKLLEEGQIPFVKTGTHRRVRLSDLMAYKRRRDAERERALDYLTQLNQEMGLYEL